MKVDAVKAHLAVALDLDLSCAAALMVLDFCALGRTRRLLSAGDPIRHGVFEGQLGISIDRDIQLVNGEVTFWTRDGGTALVIVSRLCCQHSAG